jgi:cytoskeletal protein CcmA (bactofilin family)
VRAAQLIEVHAPSRVYGDLSAPELLIDKGALFEGRCMMAQPSGPARLPRPPEG